jgi:diaminopimelate epimerase
MEKNKSNGGLYFVIVPYLFSHIKFPIFPCWQLRNAYFCDVFEIIISMKSLSTIIQFYKYHGAGNDFILLDNREGKIKLSTEQIAAMCHRHLGIGADGLMLLENAEGYDFRMVYYNSDGRESTMCGNGGRCMAAFAKSLGIINNTASFLAVDGEHSAAIAENGQISLHMNEAGEIQIYDGYAILNTGSPHYVLWVSDVKKTDVFKEGKKIRNQPEYQPDGINVNFVQIHDGKLSVRTYERGVEDETMSCGTGVTAAAIAATAKFMGEFSTDVETPGGNLEVSFTKTNPTSATNIVLTGPAVFVFNGEIDLFVE